MYHGVKYSDAVEHLYCPRPWRLLGLAHGGNDRRGDKTERFGQRQGRRDL